MKPTKIYVKSCLAAIKTGGVHALAHITGGGIPENLPRVLPKGAIAEVDISWPVTPLFKWLISAGNMAPHEALRTFNCGIGMILVVDSKRVDEISDILVQHGETVYPIGGILMKQDGKDPHVVISNENILKF